MKYDFVIVGAGLSGSVLAGEMNKAEKNIWSQTKEIILEEMFILKMWKELMFTNAVHIYFIPIIRKFGIM